MHESLNKSPAGCVQANIPPGREMRHRLRDTIAGYVASQRIAPPLGLEELRGHAQTVLKLCGLEETFAHYAAVMLSNEIWRDYVAAVPFARRLLLLPRCLRDKARCQGKLDGVGLLCRECGSCGLAGLQQLARKLGYVVLVAEGTAVVMSLVASGQVEAVIGVSCLSSLERVYPYMEEAAIPALAIPLLRDGCCDTSVDLDWVQEAIQLGRSKAMHGVGDPSSRQDGATMVDIQELRQHVERWFEPAALAHLLGSPSSQTERLAQEWLAQAGKRWRPMLGACAYQAFRQDPARSGDFQALAVAVECFHKASLIHDDIEDADSFRYGQKTLHERVGVPMALNVGDFLLGEGYRLIGRCQASDETRSAMLNVAAGGHRSLCVGQGEELWWLRHPRPMQPTEVIEIFRRKTAPAFEVALSLGAMLAGVRNGVWSSLTAYSEALGIAYQIQDDLDDWRELEAGSTQMKLGPSILLALAYESADERQRPTIQQAWSAGEPTKTAHQELVWLLRELHVERQARTLLESYKRQAVRALDGIEQPLPKLLLRRLLSRILGVVHKAQVHEELPSGDAPGRPFGAESAA